MRAITLAFAFACGAALAAVPAWAAPNPPKAATYAETPSVVLIANGCGPGWHWKPGWRGPYGAWHHGRCVPN
jgi:hypothetical protein